MNANGFDRGAYLKVLQGPSKPAVSDPVKASQQAARDAAARDQRMAEAKARQSTPAALEAKRTVLAEIRTDLLDVHVTEEETRLEAKQIAARNVAAKSAASGHGWTDRQELKGEKTPPDIFHVEQPGGSYRPVGRSGRWHLVFGASGSAKTFLVAGWAAEYLRKGSAVAWYDFEDQGDDLPDMIKAFGIIDVGGDHDFGGQLHFFGPEAPPVVGEVIDYCEHYGIKLVVMDAQRGAIQNAVPGDYGNSGTDVELFSSQLVRPLTRAGLTVVTIEHVGVSTTTGRPLGSERKISAVDIAFEAERGADIYEGAELGYSRLTVRKYRGGFFRRDTAAAHMVYENGKARFKLEVVKPTLEGFTQQNGTVNLDLARIDAVATYVDNHPDDLPNQDQLCTRLMETGSDLFTSVTRTKEAIKLAAGSGKVVARSTGRGREKSYEPASKS